MSVIFAKSKGLTDQETHYCPGCTHGIIQRLVAEVLVEMDLLGDTIGCAAVGLFFQYSPVRFTIAIKNYFRYSIKIC